MVAENDEGVADGEVEVAVIIMVIDGLVLEALEAAADGIQTNGHLAVLAFRLAVTVEDLVEEGE